MKFRMEVIKFTRTSFERQILESVCIQQNTQHNLLNSRSDYNRCSLPRLSTRLGDKEFKKYEKQLEEAKKKEESLEQRIGDMRKTRCKTRGHRNQKTNPPAKRRKTGKETYTRTCVIWETAGLRQEHEEEQDDDRKKAEKRTEDLETPAPKRQKLSQNDIRRILTKTDIEQPAHLPTNPPTPQQHITPESLAEQEEENKSNS